MNNTFENHSGKLFVFGLLVILLVLGFHEYLLMHPIGPHYFRQTDSLAFVAYYINNDFNFFEPGMWNLGNGNGKACSEFPILYYLGALVSVFTDNKHVVMRLLNFSISLLGFYYVFAIVRLIVKNNVTSILLSLLLISSTILLFYSVNFLPDSSALAFTIAGWHFGLKLGFGKQKTNLTTPFLFFLLASLLKVTYFIHPLAFVCAIAFKRFRSNQSLRDIISTDKKNIFVFLLVLFCVFFWNWFSVDYNSRFASDKFLMTILPIWELTPALFSRVWLAIHHDWFSSYYYPTTIHAFFVIGLLGAIAWFKTHEESPIPSILLFLLLGLVGYSLLFYSQFLDHDYYFLNFYPFVVIGIAFFYGRLLLWMPKVMQSLYSNLVLLVLLALSFNYANGKLKERFSFISPVFEKNRAELEGIDGYFDAQNISMKSTFLVLGEPTANGAFYWMNRSGWNIDKWDEKGKKTWATYKDKADYIVLTPGFNEFEKTDFKLFDKFRNIEIYVDKY